MDVEPKKAEVELNDEADENDEEQKPKVSEKQMYLNLKKQQKKEWNQFMRFMKKNPEALMGFVDQ